MEAKRFHGKIGEEYEMFKLACPYFDNLQSCVGREIKKYYNNSPITQIKVIEIGCGPGYTTEVILKSDPRCIVIAVDNEGVMVKQAKDFLKQHVDSGRVKIVLADALSYLKSLDTESFDVFASGFTLHNFNKNYRKELLVEIYCILKQGGLFVNADKYSLDDHVEHKKTLNWQFEKFKEVYSKIERFDLIEEWIKHYLEDDAPEVVMKEGVSITIMKEIGFNDINIVFREQTDAIIVASK